MSKKRTERGRDMEEGLIELRSYYQNLGMNRYKWEGLPEEIPVFIPEKWLYTQGQCAMIQLPESDTYGIFPVAWGQMDLDYYGYPRSWHCYVLGSSPGADLIRNTVYTEENSVLIWNNHTRTGLSKYVDMMCRRMLETDNTIRTNILVQNTPFFVKGTAENMLTAKNIFNLYQLEPAVFTTELGMQDLSFDVLNPDVTFIGDKLNDQYEEYHGRILRYLGVDHIAVEKQERLLTAEADSGDDVNNLIMESRLMLRKRACDQMKEVFGLDVTCDINERREPTVEAEDSTAGIGGAALEG